MQNKGTGDQGKGGLMKLYHAGAQRITDATYYRELVRKEEAEYQKLFAEYMSKVM